MEGARIASLTVVVIMAFRIPLFIITVFFVDYSTSVESDFNKKLIHLYGIPHSGKVTSSVFISPIGEEHYELFAPLTGIYHDFVQQAHARDSEVNDTTWCTRCVTGVKLCDWHTC